MKSLSQDSFAIYIDKTDREKLYVNTLQYEKRIFAVFNKRRFVAHTP